MATKKRKAVSAKGRKPAKRKTATKRKRSTGTSKVALISRKAKAIRRPGEAWTNAISRASKMV